MGGMFKDRGMKQTGQTTTTLDPASQQYVDSQRELAQQGANVATGGGPYFTGPQQMSVADQAAQFMNPYQQQVIDATKGQYDQLRAQASMGSNQQATQQNAFGGSRQAVMEGARLGQLDQGQAQTMANLYSGGYQNALEQGTAYSEQQRQLEQQKMQEPLWRQQQALGMYNQGMGPVGQTNTEYAPQGSRFGSMVGGAMTGFGAGGPWGALAGGAAGGLFG